MRTRSAARRFWTSVVSIALLSCHEGETTMSPPLRETDQRASTRKSFAEDVAFLSAHAPVKVLESREGGRLAVSAEYQGRVMTSAVDPGGASLGFINRSFIEGNEKGTQFDNYGGEDRF